VKDVWVAGQQLVEDRRLSQMDEAALAANARAWGARIGGRNE